MNPNMHKNKLLLEGRIRYELHDVITGKTYKSNWIQNLVTTVGKQAILNVLRAKPAGLPANAGKITYGVVGTDDTAPVIANVALGTELARAVTSYTELNGTTIEVRVFFETGEANGALKEFAWFGEDAGAGADSGTMFNHVAIDVTKGATKTLTIVQEFTM